MADRKVPPGPNLRGHAVRPPRSSSSRPRAPAGQRRSAPALPRRRGGATRAGLHPFPIGRDRLDLGPGGSR